MIVMQTDTGTDLQNMLNSLGVYIMEWRMHLSDVWLQKNGITLIIAIIISVISITFGFQLSFFFLIYNFFKAMIFFPPTYSHAHLIFCLNCFCHVSIAWCIWYSLDLSVVTTVEI